MEVLLGVCLTGFVQCLQHLWRFKKIKRRNTVKLWEIFEENTAVLGKWWEECVLLSYRPGIRIPNVWCRCTLSLCSEIVGVMMKYVMTWNEFTEVSVEGIYHMESYNLKLVFLFVHWTLSNIGPKAIFQYHHYTIGQKNTTVCIQQLSSWPEFIEPNFLSRIYLSQLLLFTGIYLTDVLNGVICH